ncbi:MAG: H-type small acid-soluble spore protein [Eubacteriaceae bacterium]
MDKQRAREIVSSPNMVNVTFNGEQIYIEKVNDRMETASIHTLNQPENKQTVPLDNLIEE